MKFIVASLCLVAHAGVAVGTPEREGSLGVGEFGGTPQDQILEQLMAGEHTRQEFDSLLEKAKKLGVSEQVLLEAKFAYFAERKDFAGVASLADELSNFEAKFNPAVSEIFAQKPDFLSAAQFAQSVRKWLSGDFEGFRKGVLEAYWLSPRQGGGFAPFIEKAKLMEEVGKLQPDLDVELSRQLAKGKVKLKEILPAGKPMVLHFWTCGGDSELFSPKDLKDLESRVKKQGAGFVSIFRGSSPAAQRDAVDYLANAAVPGSVWLVDDAEPTLATRLLVSESPTFVILNPQGKIVFHGSPAEPGFDAALSSGEAVRPGEQVKEKSGDSR